jgi:hypothetical protein
VQALLVFLLHSFRVLKQSADFLPDGRVRLVHAHLLVPAHPLKALPRDIHRAGTAVIGIARIIGAPTISIPTFGTDEQALQEVARALLGDACSSPILFQLCLHGIEQGGIYQGWHGDGDPLVFGGIFARVSSSRLSRPAAWGA